MQYYTHLNKDKVLRKLIRRHGSISFNLRKNICLQICASIISQQLSTKAAAVIYGRFLSLFKTRSPNPQQILSLSHQQLRSVGLSNAKAVYVKNVSNFFIENKLSDIKITALDNEELIALFTQIKGVGRWTVEMILMFALAREDIFSTADLGLQKAMIRLYNIEYADKKELIAKMILISDKWKPYRSYACKYLWHYLDNPLAPI